MGVNKVRMGVGFEQLVGWDLSQIWQGISKVAALSTALYI